MSMLSRLRPVAVSSSQRRAYSSFFSSKSGSGSGSGSGGGGGRHFASAKPPKAFVGAAAANKAKAGALGPTAAVAVATGAAEDVGEGGKKVQQSHTGAATKTTAAVVADDGDASSSSSSSAAAAAAQDSSHVQTKSTATPHANANAAADNNTSTSRVPPASASNFPGAHTSNAAAATRLYHPSIDTSEFKLLQFFSSHRPLLLLSHPTDIFSSQSSFLTHRLPPPSSQHPQIILAADAPPTPPSASIDDPMEADAEAARQLSRALTMSCVGGAVSWDAAMQRLGLGVSEEVVEENKVMMEREWEEVMLDSVKRKRRKKMKKHKLKKRRRLTRASRLKMGR